MFDGAGGAELPGGSVWRSRQWGDVLMVADQSKTGAGGYGLIIAPAEQRDRLVEKLKGAGLVVASSLEEAESGADRARACRAMGWR
jgi:hypothetical protein